MLILILEVFCNFSEIYSFCTKEKNTEQFKICRTLNTLPIQILNVYLMQIQLH